jgi:hypothetical protein
MCGPVARLASAFLVCRFHFHEDWGHKVDPTKGFVRVEWKQFRSWLVVWSAESPLRAAWAAINGLLRGTLLAAGILADYFVACWRVVFSLGNSDQQRPHKLDGEELYKTCSNLQQLAARARAACGRACCLRAGHVHGTCVSCWRILPTMLPSSNAGHSWGGGWQEGYEDSSQQFDAFLWREPSSVAFVAAGNDGQYPEEAGARHDPQLLPRCKMRRKVAWRRTHQPLSLPLSSTQGPWPAHLLQRAQ